MPNAALKIGYESELRARRLVTELTQSVELTAARVAGSVQPEFQFVLGGQLTIATELAARFTRLLALSAGAPPFVGHEVAFADEFERLQAGFGGMNVTPNELLKMGTGAGWQRACEHFATSVDAFRRGFYHDALESIQRAIHGDSTTAGYRIEWRFWYLRGIILLGSEQNWDPATVNPAEAEESFAAAARYALPRSKTDAARALTLAAVAALAQSSITKWKLRDALEHATQANELDSSFSLALFQAARAFMLSGDVPRGLLRLRHAVEHDALYAIRAALDPAFAEHSSKVTQYLELIRREKQEQLIPIAHETLSKYGDRLNFLRADEKSAAAVARLEEVVIGSPGLTTLWSLRPADLHADAQCIRTAHDELASRVVLASTNSKHVVNQAFEVDERRSLSQIFEVEVPYHVQETYTETVVVKPSAMFRAAVTQDVERVRTVEKTRKEFQTRQVETAVRVTRLVPTERQVRQIVLRDAFGNEIDMGGVIPWRFASILPAKFVMGSPEDEPQRSPDETPHETRLTHAFEIQCTPVTEAQWKALTGTLPSQRGPNHPVTNISWYDAIRYCNALSRSQGLPEAYTLDGEDTRFLGSEHPGYRLPTEAEWECAARAGTTTTRYGELGAIAWFAANSGGGTQAVSSRGANSWGIYDMLGNVWEWCWDRYGPYGAGEAVDPSGPNTGELRVFRGGSWHSHAGRVRAACRGRWNPSLRYDFVGFRPVRTVQF